MQKTIVLASDHTGVSLRNVLANALRQDGYKVLDVGVFSEEPSDYTDFGYQAAAAIIEGRAEWGIILCGTGIGISIAANRYPQIRAALCRDVQTAELARKHNNANILALGARLLDESTALACARAFLATAFEGGRHEKRVAKLGAVPVITSSSHSINQTKAL